MREKQFCPPMHPVVIVADNVSSKPEKCSESLESQLTSSSLVPVPVSTTGARTS